MADDHLADFGPQGGVGVVETLDIIFGAHFKVAGCRLTVVN
jgi:hypothetical protein